MTTEATMSLAALNDQFRKNPLAHGRLMLTIGVRSKGEAFVSRVLRGIASYENFPHGDDPYGEHDFGAFVIDSERVFWKIDYYDPTMTFGSADPKNETKTLRVMTVMLAEEY